MDLLNPVDRAFLAGILQDFFKPVGTTKEFVIVAIGEDGHGFVTHVTKDENPANAMQILRAVVESEVADEFTLGDS